jgi:uncharacterized 2Fe-2S/4Fe-4S cluster protein (DUF4445 family)
MNSGEKTFQVQFQPLGKRVEVPARATLLEAARQAGIELASACGGEASCGQCLVILKKGETNPLTSAEQFILSETDIKSGYRLACCTQVLSDITAQIPKESFISGQRLQVESNLAEIAPDALIRSYPFALEAATLDDTRADLKRLADEITAQYQQSDLKAGLAVIQDLPTTLRQIDWKGVAFIKDREIITVLAEGEKPIGFAIDLGTTKIAAHLVDLETGDNLATAGIANPQSSYGEDVINRLAYVIRNPQGGRELAGLVRRSLDELLGELLEQAGMKRKQVVEGCLVGNTAMTHLLLELPERQLANAPYVAAYSEALDVAMGDLQLETAPGASLHIPPNIGGFVGSDHVAMMLASDLDRSHKVTLGIDIGTNTEISLRIPGSEDLTAVSCASGPAFEGAHIKYGMRAASGAIDKVRIHDGKVELTTINDQPPIGICGSGILDTVAELYQGGYLNETGRFQKGNQRIRSGDHGAEFLIVTAKDSGSGKEIVINQKDVNEVLLAVGAINAGFNILLDVTGTPHTSVEDVIVAGAFGTFLNIHNAIRIGLFLRFPNAHYRQVGNAAALGAKWMLISGAARKRAQEIARRTRYQELTSYPNFNRQFARGMIFPKRDEQ